MPSFLGTIWKCTQVAIRGSPAKGVGREIDARVQIPSLPPTVNQAYAHSCKLKSIDIYQKSKISDFARLGR